jgi:hypothetical protein
MSKARNISNLFSASTDVSTDAEVTSAIASHSSAADPHTVYLKESEYNAAGKNYFINGAMDFWQRGTSFTTPGGAYTADRYKVTVNGAGTYVVSRQAAGLDGFQYCLRFQRSSGQTYTSGSFIGYAWTPEDAVLMQGKTVTYSFYARKGSDFSSASPAGGINIQLQQGTGSGTHAFSSLTNETNVLTGNATLTTSWQRFSFTGTVATNTTELRTNIAHSPSGTAGTNDYYEITGLQLEIGSSATQFSRSGGNIQGELSACQRYYQKSYPLTTVPGTASSNNGYVATRTDAGFEAWAPIRFPVPMRVAPTISVFSPNSGNSGKGNSSGNVEYTAYGEAMGEFGFSLLAINTGGSAIQVRMHYVASAEL